jgi:hypothetical protein
MKFRFVFLFLAFAVVFSKQTSIKKSKHLWAHNPEKWLVDSSRARRCLQPLPRSRLLARLVHRSLTSLVVPRSIVDLWNLQRQF